MEIKRRLQAVVEYSSTIRAEDSVDSNLTGIPLINNRGKYCQSIFFHRFDQIIWNSCVLYCKNGGVRNHLQIRIELAELVNQKYHLEDGNSKPGCLGTEADSHQVDRMTLSCVHSTNRQ
jgi:hypothetical protein